jgi:two-component system sensor histidine kinase/response regulator
MPAAPDSPSPASARTPAAPSEFPGPLSPGTLTSQLGALRRAIRVSHVVLAAIALLGLLAVQLDVRTASVDHQLLREASELIGASDELVPLTAVQGMTGGSAGRDSGTEPAREDWLESIERLGRRQVAFLENVATKCPKAERDPAETALQHLVAVAQSFPTANSEGDDLRPHLDALERARESWMLTIEGLEHELEHAHDAHREAHAWLIRGVAILALVALVLEWFLLICPAMSVAQRAATEFARRAQEHARLALLAERTVNAVLVTDREGRIEWVNDGFERMTGFGAAEVCGRTPCTILVSDRTDAAALEALQDAIRRGQDFTGEFVQRTKAGRELTVAITVRPLEEVPGVVTGFMAMQTDVTEDRALARELEENERRMRLLVESTDIVVWEFDRATHSFTYIAPQVERFGFPLEDWKRPGFWVETLHPEDRKLALDLCREATDRRADHRLQYRMVTPKGTVWIDDIVSVFEEADGRVILRGAFVNITAQKAAERELEEISERLRVEAERLGLALAGSEIGLWDWNPVSDALHVDARWALNVGMALHQLTGTLLDFQSRIHPDDAEAARAAMEAHFRGEAEFYEATYRMRHAAGHWVWILARGKVVAHDSTGHPTRVVGTQLDRTAEVERERVLEDLRRAAETASRTKSEFLANMSHEIRTPLTAILGFTELLRDESDELEPARRNEMLDTIQGAGSHLLTVINDILDLSKIEADRMTVEAIETSLPDLLREVVRLVEPQARAKGLELRTELLEPIPCTMVTDPTRLRQILMNLLGNAVKFTETGHVVLRVCRASSDILRVEIADTGTGMTDAEIGQLFRPFLQADGSVTRRFGGTGLGLNISRRLARLMGGDVYLASSKLGVGSRFVVEVPSKYDPASGWVDALPSSTVGTAAEGDAATAALNGRVLLVEDGAMNQRLVRAMLERAGATVVVADHGQEALDRIAEADRASQPFDLIVTDMQMPEMDGYTLVRLLRHRGDRTPIVAVTAHAMTEDRERCLAAGCDDYTTKPVSRAALLGICGRLLGHGDVVGEVAA